MSGILHYFVPFCFFCLLRNIVFYCTGKFRAACMMHTVSPVHTAVHCVWLHMSNFDKSLQSCGLFGMDALTKFVKNSLKNFWQRLGSHIRVIIPLAGKDSIPHSQVEQKFRHRQRSCTPAQPKQHFFWFNMIRKKIPLSTTTVVRSVILPSLLVHSCYTCLKGKA